MNRTIAHIAPLICIWLLTACSGNTIAPATLAPASPLPTGTPTAIPFTATPAYTPNFVTGFGDIPTGKYLFVEYWNETGAQETVPGKCQPIAMDFPNYRFDAQTLRLSGMFNWGLVKPPNSVKGFFGNGRSLQGKAGGGIYSFLEPIIGLPFRGINGVNKDGTIEVEMEGHLEILKPNESWQKTENSEATPGCQQTTTIRFTNYGLLKKSDLDLRQP